MAAFGIDESGELWVDVTNHDDAAQSRIAELEAEVARLKMAAASDRHDILRLQDEIRALTRPT